MYGSLIKTLFIACAVLSLSVPVFAQEPPSAVVEDPSSELPALTYTYDEEFCGFMVNFPSEPSIRDIDIPDAPDMHAQSLSYVHIFDIDKSIRIRANCKAITKDLRKFISQKSLEQELAAVERDQGLMNPVKNHKVIIEKRLRIASLSAEKEGQNGDGLLIYQIWVSDGSIFTFEAELTGPSHPDSDKMLVAILQSLKKKDDKETDL